MHYYYIYHHIYYKKIYLINEDSLLITLVHLMIVDRNQYKR